MGPNLGSTTRSIVTAGDGWFQGTLRIRKALEDATMKDVTHRRDDEVAPKASSTNKLSLVGDWLAPTLVWLLVITMGLAIVGFLLGNR